MPKATRKSSNETEEYGFSPVTNPEEAKGPHLGPGSANSKHKGEDRIRRYERPSKTDFGKYED